jgi:uncharacterized membrane protein
MSDEQPRDDETPKERADRELIELLNELRVVLPGVTVLLAFLLAVPFANGWTRVTAFQRERIVRIGNRLTIAGIVASAVSLLAVVVLVMDSVVSRGAAIAAAAALFAVIAVLWYGLALRAWIRDRSAR